MEQGSWFQNTKDRYLDLNELRQFRTYEGLLEGLPSRDYNSRLIENAIDHARSAWPWHGEPHVIPPIEREIENSSNFMAKPGPKGLLPDICCIARFSSNSPARDPNCHCSRLTVVWWQDKFALPIDPLIKAYLMTMDWDSLAIDGKY